VDGKKIARLLLFDLWGGGVLTWLLVFDLELDSECELDCELERERVFWFVCSSSTCWLARKLERVFWYGAIACGPVSWLR
jgi:hypothetical protein